MSDEQNVSTTSVVDNGADNSSLEEQVSAALDAQDQSSNEEPANQQVADAQENQDTQNGENPSKTENKKDNTQEELTYPEKFKNADGTLNTKNLLKSYGELEPLLNQKAEWEKEKALLLEKAKFADEVKAQREAEAKSKGFDSIDEMQTLQDLIGVTVDEYMKYVSQTDDPNYTMNLLNQYRLNPTAELMSEIEIEFSSPVNKRVAIAAERRRAEIEANKATMQQNAAMNNIKANIGVAVQKHSDVLSVEPVKNLYIKALQRYGDNFTEDDCDALAAFALELKDYFFKEFEAEKKKKDENDSELNKLSGITPKSGAKSDVNINKSIEEMTDDELEKYIYKLV